MHFDVEKDIPIIFEMAFKMMGILEKLTTKYEEFRKIDTRKIFIENFPAFRGLEYPRVIVVLDQNLNGLEQYLPECLNRCTTYLHALLLNENSEMFKKAQHLKSIITAWRNPQLSNMLINSWRVAISASDTNQGSEQFYKKRPSFIQIHQTSRRYKEFEENFLKLQLFQNRNTNHEKISQEEITSVVAR